MKAHRMKFLAAMLVLLYPAWLTKAVSELPSISPTFEIVWAVVGIIAPLLCIAYLVNCFVETLIGSAAVK